MDTKTRVKIGVAVLALVFAGWAMWRWLGDGPMQDARAEEQKRQEELRQQHPIDAAPEPAPGKATTPRKSG